MLTIITILLSLSTPTALGATGSHTQDLSMMREHSEQVVRGVVRASNSRLTQRGIVTEYLIDVEEVLHGKQINTLSIRLPGGEYEDLIEKVSGVPIWQNGDEVLVFVPKTGPLSFTGLFTLFGESLVAEMPHPREAFPRTISEFEDQLRRLPATY